MYLTTHSSYRVPPGEKSPVLIARDDSPLTYWVSPAATRPGWVRRRDAYEWFSAGAPDPEVAFFTYNTTVPFALNGQKALLETVVRARRAGASACSRPRSPS